MHCVLISAYSDCLELTKVRVLVAGDPKLHRKNNLFHPNHHGGLPSHSIATALIQLVDMWIEAAEKKELSGVRIIDQSAAYDLLDHFLFPKKLREYNFDEASIKRIQSYLGDRSSVSR